MQSDPVSRQTRRQRAVAAPPSRTHLKPAAQSVKKSHGSSRTYGPGHSQDRRPLLSTKQPSSGLPHVVVAATGTQTRCGN